MPPAPNETGMVVDGLTMMGKVDVVSCALRAHGGAYGPDGERLDCGCTLAIKFFRSYVQILCPRPEGGAP